jgi:hypothetical protein
MSPTAAMVLMNICIIAIIHILLSPHLFDAPDLVSLLTSYTLVMARFIVPIHGMMSWHLFSILSAQGPAHAMDLLWHAVTSPLCSLSTHGPEQ